MIGDEEDDYFWTDERQLAEVLTRQTDMLGCPGGLAHTIKEYNTLNKNKLNQNVIKGKQ